MASQNRDHPDAVGAPSNPEMDLYSATERVLGTPELLRAIHDVFQIGWASDEEREGDALGRDANRADLASCARVSRRFSEHALDVLWRTLDTTLPLLRALPRFHLIEGHTWALARDITTAEWARFQTYALRVRGLRFELPCVDPVVWTLLARNCKGRPILPNLTIISTTDLTTEHVGAMIQFLSPRLSAAYISFAPPESWSTPPSVAYNASGLLFESLSGIAPRLITLHWSTPGLIPKTYPLDIKRFQRLTSFTTGDLVADLPLVLGLSTIWSLTHLSLSIHLSDAECARLRNVFDPLAAFQGLRTLSLSGRARDVAVVMSCMRPASLEELTLDLTVAPISIITPGSLLSELCQYLPQSLESFTLSIVSLTQPTASNSGFELHDHLYPLLSFKNLWHFGLSHKDPMLQVTDLGLSLLAEAWPKLQSVRIDLPHPAAARTARPTVSALVAFAQRCPELYSLSLCGLDASSLPPDASVPLLDHPLEHICLKLVAYNAGDDEQALRFATTLDRMFPHLVDVYICDDMHSPYLRHSGPTSSWLVQQFLKAIHSGREHDKMFREGSTSVPGLGSGPTVKDGSEPRGSSS